MKPIAPSVTSTDVNGAVVSNDSPANKAAPPDSSFAVSQASRTRVILSSFLPSDRFVVLRGEAAVVYWSGGRRGC